MEDRNHALNVPRESGSAILVTPAAHDAESRTLHVPTRSLLDGGRVQLPRATRGMI
jgi:hypothetical protein